MESFLKEMKADLDQLHELPWKSYENLSVYLLFKKFNKGAIIKGPDTAESSARYLSEGVLGYYIRNENKLSLDLVYSAKTVVFDRLSYFSGEATPHQIKSLTDGYYFELTKESEALVLKKFPEFLLLAHRIFHRSNFRIAQQQYFQRLKLREGYPLFMEHFPGLGRVMTQSDVAGFFNVDLKTLYRYLKER